MSVVVRFPRARVRQVEFVPVHLERQARAGWPPGSPCPASRCRSIGAARPRRPSQALDLIGHAVQGEVVVVESAPGRTPPYMGTRCGAAVPPGPINRCWEAPPIAHGQQRAPVRVGVAGCGRLHDRRCRGARDHLFIALPVGEAHRHLERLAQVRRDGRVGRRGGAGDVGLGASVHPDPLEFVVAGKGRGQAVAVGNHAGFQPSACCPPGRNRQSWARP